jgi:ABC-type nitrate/sulfonate/bicarbonate transport system substrate-binding protein
VTALQRGRRRGQAGVEKVEASDVEVEILFPSGVSVRLLLAGKSLDVSASVGGRPALVRSDVRASPQITLDILEPRGPAE